MDVTQIDLVIGAPGKTFQVKGRADNGSTEPLPGSGPVVVTPNSGALTCTVVGNGSAFKVECTPPGYVGNFSIHIAWPGEPAIDIPVTVTAPPPPATSIFIEEV